jgi:hypothetical protein
MRKLIPQWTLKGVTASPWWGIIQQLSKDDDQPRGEKSLEFMNAFPYNQIGSLACKETAH